MNNSLTNIFEKNKFIYQKVYSNPHRSCYILKFSMNTCDTDYYIEICSGKKLMFVYAVFPIKIPLARRTDMAVFTALFNNNLTTGCWEINMLDGTLKFRISYIYDDNSNNFEHNLLENLDLSIKYTDICSPSIMSVIFANANPYDVFMELTGNIDIAMN